MIYQIQHCHPLLEFIASHNIFLTKFINDELLAGDCPLKFEALLDQINQRIQQTISNDIFQNMEQFNPAMTKLEEAEKFDGQNVWIREKKNSIFLSRETLQI